MIAFLLQYLSLVRPYPVVLGSSSNEALCDLRSGVVSLGAQHVARTWPMGS